MAELKNVEIARVGQWKLASGPLEVTPQMLADAADYANRAGARPGYLKIGHTDPRFTGDGEPSLGWLQNLRVEGTGDESVLLGDIVDMPEWLVEAAPKHWPDRSMEGWTDLEADGRTYAMVVDGLALLGVTPPGMSSLRSLRDLPQALGVAASARIVATIAAASDTPWSQFSDSDYTDSQYARACVLDRGPSAGTAKQRYSLPIREPSGALNRNGVHAAASRIGSVSASPEAKKAAARALIRAYGELGEEPPDSLRSIAAAELPTASADGPINTEGGSAVAFSDEQITNLRAKLQLPETADEAAIVAAVNAVVDESLEEREPAAAAASSSGGQSQSTTTTESSSAEATPTAVAAGPGTMVIDAAAWQQREEAIKRLEAAEAKRRREERDQIIAQAISAGKFPPARREHWVRLWDADPEGTRIVVDGLTPNVVPVTAMGELGVDEDSYDEEFAHLFPPTPTAPKGA